MYEQATAYPPGSQVNTSPAVENVLKTIEGLNGDISVYLSDIESKMHSLLNLRQPQPEQKNSTPSPNISDFFTALNVQIDKLVVSRNRLTAICQHLTQII